MAKKCCCSANRNNSTVPRVDLFRKYFERRGTNDPIMRWLAWLNIRSGGKPQ